MSAIAKKKRIWTMVLFYATCGLLLVSTAIAMLRGPAPVVLWIFPVLAFGVGVTSAINLRALSQKEPSSGRGFWQLGIQDHIGVVFVCGISLGLWNSLRGDNFLAPGVPICLSLSVAYAIGLLSAAKIGIRQALWRGLYAVGFAFRWLGGVGIESLFLIVVLGAFVVGPGAAITLVPEVLWNEKIGHHWLAFTIRFLTMVFPIGLVLHAVVLRKIPKTNDRAEVAREEERDAS